MLGRSPADGLPPACRQCAATVGVIAPSQPALLTLPCLHCLARTMSGQSSARSNCHLCAAVAPDSASVMCCRPRHNAAQLRVWLMTSIILPFLCVRAGRLDGNAHLCALHLQEPSLPRCPRRVHLWRQAAGHRPSAARHRATCFSARCRPSYTICPSHTRWLLRCKGDWCATVGRMFCQL